MDRTSARRVCSLLTVIALMVASAALPLPARGQSCLGQWLDGEGIPGPNGFVHTSMVWDPDGPGPLPPVLVVAGEFSVVGRSVSSNIAVWNGSDWSSLGSGVNGVVW